MIGDGAVVSGTGPPSSNILTQTSKGRAHITVRTDEPSQLWIVITAGYIAPSRLILMHISAVSQRIKLCQDTGGSQGAPIRIVGVGRLDSAGIVYHVHHIALQVGDVVVDGGGSVDGSADGVTQKFAAGVDVVMSLCSCGYQCSTQVSTVTVLLECRPLASQV